MALFFGALLAFFFYKDIKREVAALSSDDDNVYVFQAGVFKDQANAINFKNNYHNSYLYFDGEYYRVFLGVTINNKTKVQDYLDSFNYDYYIKKVKINHNTFEKIARYDDVLTKGSKNKTIEVVLKEINELFLKSQA